MNDAPVRDMDDVERRRLTDYVWKYLDNHLAESEIELDSHLLDRFSGQGSRNVPEAAYPELEDVYFRFREAVADRILAQHPQIEIARCRFCGAVLRTPVARQCPRCKRDWYDESAGKQAP